MDRKYNEQVSELVKKTKFRKRLFGGVDEADVWKKLQAICDEYDKAFEKQEAYFRGLMDGKGIREKEGGETVNEE